MKLRALLLIILLLFAGWSRSYAQEGAEDHPGPVILTDEQDEYPLGLYLDILEDPGGELSVEDVSSPEYADQFRASQVEVPNFGFSDSSYWLRFRLHNESRLIDQWILEVAYSNVHFVDLFIPMPGGDEFQVKQSGTLRPPSSRELFYPQIIFNLSIPHQSDQTIYMRVKNGASMTLPLSLWEPSTFVSNSVPKLIWLGIFLGIMVGLLGYNLFLFISLRDSSYLYLVLLLSGIVFYDVIQNGMFGVYILPGLYFLNSQAVAFAVALIFSSLILFNDVFVSAKNLLPRIHAVNLAFVALWAVLGISILVVSYHDLALIMSPTIVVTLVLVAVNGLLAWRKGFRATRFLLIAWVGLLLGLLLFILTRMGITPSNFLSENSYRLGFAWMAVCWSIALADRISILKTETEESNRRLQSAENRLSQILEGLPLGVVVYGKDFKPTFVNQRAIEILGNPDQGIEPDLNAGRTLDQAMAYYSFQLAGSEQVYPVEKLPVYRALQGEPAMVDDIEADLVDRRVPLEIWANPVADAAGDIESAVVAFQDITIRRQAEEAQRTSEKRFRAIVENVFDGIAFLDRDRKILYVSPSYEQLNGVRAEEMIGKSGALTVHPDDQTYVAAAFQTLLQQPGGRVSAEYRIRHQDGSWIWVETRVMNLLDDPHVQAVVLSSRDVTERKETETALAEYRDHLERLVEIRTTELSATNEWLSVLKQVRQTVGGTADLPQAFEKLLTSIVASLNAGSAFFLWDDGRGEYSVVESLRQTKNDSARGLEIPVLIFSSDRALQDEIGTEKIVQLSAERIASLPASIGDILGDILLERDYQSILLIPWGADQAVASVFGIGGQQKPLQEITAAQFELIKTMAHDLADLVEAAQLLDRAQALRVAEERNSLAQDLHDSVTQILFSASVLAESVPRIWDKDQAIARMNMDKLSVLLRGALAEMRSLLFELRADQQQIQSLDNLLSTLADSTRARTQVDILLTTDDVPELPAEVTQVFYRVAREALNNVVRHAEAAHVSITMLNKAHCAELHIEDDGRGFNPQEVAIEHMGISIMSERAAKINADLQIRSEPGRGTEVIVIWPGNGAESENHD
ncbi:MAG: 7TM-DISM domain-containing protein [Candidatus Promineifilaceae bacterium]